MNEERIHLALCANQRYFPGLYCAVGSALASLAPAFRATVHIIDGGFSAEGKRRLEKIADRLGGHLICWIMPVEELFSGIQTGNYPITACYRLALPELLDVDRVIYLDADLLVFGCLGELWKQAGSFSKPVCAVQDRETPYLSGDSLVLANVLGISDGKGYFNAGVMVLNLGKLRDEEFTQRSCDLLAKYGSQLRFADQSAANGLVADRWEALDGGWNTPSWVFDRQDDNALPWILHFTNSAPWLRKRFCPSQALFERIASELGLELPEPEASLLRSCLHALLQWLLAPFRVSYQGMGAMLAWALRNRARCRERLEICLHWWRYFWGGPCRVVLYWRRIREIRTTCTKWHSKFLA